MDNPLAVGVWVGCVILCTVIGMRADRLGLGVLCGAILGPLGIPLILFWTRRGERERLQRIGFYD